MDEKAERRLRRKAVRWLCLGRKPGAVAKRVGRSRTWRYLEGGTKVYAFHTLNLRTRALQQTLARNKELQTV